VARHAKTVRLMDEARAILEEGHPMTVRQVFYQLVSRLVVKNTRIEYQAVSDVLKDARREGAIPWDWVEDRLRRPHTVSMWRDLADFIETVRHAYRRDVWATQPGYVEVWLEKDALSGIFEQVLRPYGVTLNVGRGFDGWTSINDAAERYEPWEDEGKTVTVLYFGDFDPSGEDMVRSLEERLADRGVYPTVTKCALTKAVIERYHLPPAMTKASDTRSAAFVERHGDMAVELDAMPTDALAELVRSEVAAAMDLAALEATRGLEAAERQHLVELLRGL